MEHTLDPVRSAGLVTREIRTGSRDGHPTKIVVARRRYTADRADVWDAVTNADRLPRWFLPISGELHVGGRYQLEGNAGGVVESCQEPERLSVTWEFGGQVSWLQVHLSEDGDGTTLELSHEAPVDPDGWAQFGPGAAGLGWDLGMLGLDLHLAGGAAVDPAEAAVWPTTAVGSEFVRVAGEGWVQAAVDAGDDPEDARAAGARSIGFYTTPPEGAADR